MQKVLFTVAFLVAAIGVAIAVDNFSIATFGGARTVLKSTDNAGVHTLHFVMDAGGVSGGVVPVSSAVLASQTVVKGSAGNLYAFEVSADATLSAAAWWIMIFNAVSAPADGVVSPVKCYAMAPGVTSLGASWGAVPAAFSVGIVIGVSTTGCFTKTASVHAFISGDAQ
jgi:hypothetical protein